MILINSCDYDYLSVKKKTKNKLRLGICSILKQWVHSKAFCPCHEHYKSDYYCHYYYWSVYRIFWCSCCRCRC